MIDRRRALALVGGAMATLAGCAGASPSETARTTTAPSTFDAEPASLLLTAGELPQETDWGDARTKQSEEKAAVTYEVLADDGTVSHQVSLVLTRRLTSEGARLDHDHLVDTYRENDGAAVEKLPLGDVGSLVAFGDEAHVLVAFGNVFLNFGAYDGGPPAQVRRLADLQVAKLRTVRERA